jgi:flagellar biosynthesis protein FlhF
LLSRLDDATDPVRRIFDGIQALTVLFDHLRHRGVSDSLAEGIILSLREIVPPARMGDFSLVKEALRQKIRRMMRCSWGIDPSFDSNVAVFVGPTGAGKTTTVAKIAASMRLVHHLDVALISTDTFRVGAMDQISAYAEAIGTPMRVVRNEVEMMTAVRDLSHCQVVLIDTAGLGSRGSEWVDRLGLAVKSIAKCTTYLLLDMGAHLQNQMAVLRRLGGLRIDNFVFTKADECAVHGQILDLLVYTGVPVAYITNGQNVPGDIQAARTEDLADLILGPEYPQLRPPG